MEKANYQLVNGTIKNLYALLPHGSNFEYVTPKELKDDDDNQYYAIEKFITDQKLVEDWGTSGKIILTKTGVDIVEQYECNVERYLEYKKELERKANEEHELQMEALRSNIKFNKKQTKFAWINMCYLIANVILTIISIYVMMTAQLKP